MAKSIEQNVQETLGTLMFQILSLQTQLDTEREKNQVLQTELTKLKGEEKRE